MAQAHPAAHEGQLSPLLKQATHVTASHGEGAYLYDTQENRYLDFTTGIGVTSTGHCHPKVVEAVQKQAGRLIHGQYTTVLHEPLVRLTERLGAKMPGNIDSLFYANAGTEAVEASLRLARHATGKTNMIVFHGGFHGRTMGALSMTTSSVGLRAGLEPTMGGVAVSPFPFTYHYGWDEKTTTEFCLKELDRLFATVSHPCETAAMLIEPVQGEAGYIPANTEFMRGLRQRCDDNGILLIMDEVQAGYARTGRFWAHEHFDVQPDMVITAKGLASGFPLSALAAPKDLMEKGWPGSQGGTYGGNAVACAAALATLDVIEEEDLVSNAATTGDRLRKALDQLQKDHPVMGDVRGMGLMQGVEIVDADGKPDGQKAAKITDEAEKRGLLLLRCGPHGKQTVRWLPPLVVNGEQIDEAVNIFTDALKAAG